MPISLMSINQWRRSTKSFCQTYQTVIDDIANALKSIYEVVLLHKRIEYLEALVTACNEASLVITKNDAVLLIKVLKVQAQAIYLLKRIFNVTDNKELVLMLAKQHGFSNKTYQKLFTQQPDKRHSENGLLPNKCKQWDLVNQVVYFSCTEREKYRVIICDGNFYQFEPFCQQLEKRTLSLKPYSSKYNMNMLDGLGWATLVVSRYGDMFVGQTSIRQYHHSSYLAGDKAYFAGLIKTDSDGSLNCLSNESGHYLPSKCHVSDFLSHLAFRGVVKKNLTIKLVSNRFKKSEKLQIDAESFQYDARTAIHNESRLMQPKVWKQETSVGFFTRQRGDIKKLDKGLERYNECCNINSITENKKLITSMLSNANHYLKTHPAGKQRLAVAELKNQLNSEMKLWENKENLVQAQQVDLMRMRLK